MAVQLHSYISFKDNTREALEFYQSIFGGELELLPFAQYDSPHMPVAAEDKDKIMHGMVRGADGIQFMAADTPSSMVFSPNTGSRVSLALSGDDEEKLRGYWDGLSQGGKVTVPMEKSPWGDIFGMLTDRYGIDWMIDVGPK